MREPRRGKLCARKGCNRPPVAIPKRPRYGSLRDYHDPFCSRACCEAYYGRRDAADRPNHR